MVRSTMQTGRRRQSLPQQSARCGSVLLRRQSRSCTRPKAGAAIFSIVKTCRRQSLHIYQYQPAVLPGLANCSNKNLGYFTPVAYATQKRQLPIAWPKTRPSMCSARETSCKLPNMRTSSQLVTSRHTHRDSVYAALPSRSQASS